jgi:hypothetical protein
MLLSFEICAKVEISSVQILHYGRENWVANVIDFYLAFFTLNHSVRKHRSEPFT